MRTSSLLTIIVAIAFVLAGCGESVSAEQRVDRCLKKQPDATRPDCEQWESDGELMDNGTHEGHASM